MRKADAAATSEDEHDPGVPMGFLDGSQWRGRGEPLAPEVRKELETMLGVDLAGVRMHTDADRAARSISARAFAIGQDLAFRSGAYDPAPPEGRRLIAHEVAHTVQARGAHAPTAGTAVSQPDEAPEREADAFADSFVERSARPAARTDRLVPRTSIAPQVPVRPV